MIRYLWQPQALLWALYWHHYFSPYFYLKTDSEKVLKGFPSQILVSLKTDKKTKFGFIEFHFSHFKTNETYPNLI
jgi:hypothetical protein